MIRKSSLLALGIALLTGLGGDAEAGAAKNKTTALDDRHARTSFAARYCADFFGCLFGDDRSGSGGFGFGLGGGKTREIVEWSSSRYKPGTIVIRTPERKLYYVLPGGRAMRYSVGVGKEGFQWGGVSRIARKAEWPTWRPPRAMIERERRKGHFIPDFMEGGPGNPLGARALYIGGTLFRIHGTNNAATIGGAVSSGCIRMMNADVIDLYERTRIGARVYVYQ